jgi:hypothetical protein
MLNQPYTIDSQPHKRFRPPAPVTGRNVAHAPRSVSQRAVLAAQLRLGDAVLVSPTITQCAALTRVSQPCISLALKLKPATRDRVAVGELTLADAARANGLLVAWLAATPAEKAAFGIAVGVNEVWDAAISPSI